MSAYVDEVQVLSGTPSGVGEMTAISEDARLLVMNGWSSNDDGNTAITHTWWCRHRESGEIQLVPNSMVVEGPNGVFPNMEGGSGYVCSMGGSGRPVGQMWSHVGVVLSSTGAGSPTTHAKLREDRVRG